MPDAPPRKKRFLVVGPVPPPIHGGALAMRHLVDSAAGQEHELLHVDARFTDSLGELGRFSLTKGLRVFKYCWQMLRLRFFRRIDGIILTPTFVFKPFLKDAVFIWFCTLILRCRTAGWFHMNWLVMNYEQRGKLARWFVRSTLKRLDRIVLVGQRLATFLPDFLDKSRVVSLPNGIPHPPPAGPGDHPPTDRTRVVYLSNFQDAKGWRDLLQAATAICQEKQMVEFVFYGAAMDSTAEEIREAMQQAAPDGRIRWEGPVSGDEKFQALRRGHIFCFPSHSEAFPLSVIEACAVGLPVVSTDVGSVPDLIKDGLSGWLVPIKSPDLIKARLLDLINNPASCHAMGRYNLQAYQENLTLDAYGARWTKFLREW